MTDPHSNTPTREIISVAELNRRARSLLELHLPLLWVEGEVSNLSRPSSGHWYFTLKDAAAQVRCAMFRNRNALVRFSPKSGDKVVVRARTSIYEGRGDYQLIIEHMEDAGFGLLQRQFEALKQKLAGDGLFAPEHKRPLPVLPQHIAVITSPSGAAIQDVLSVLKRRFPATMVTVLPVAVQGEGSAKQIIDALQTANQSDHFDVILLCRGGGSIEDLWSFNSEALAHAIFDSKLPVVSAVGHEIDFTIADFVADVRAPTPSAAAELLSPDQADYLSSLGHLERRFQRAISAHIGTARQQLLSLHRLLRHPGQQLQAWSQRLDHLEIRLHKSWQKKIAADKKQLEHTLQRFRTQTPALKLSRSKQQLASSEQRLEQALRRTLKDQNARMQKAMALLNIVSPLNTLERGYSITRNAIGEVVRNSDHVNEGEMLNITLHQGALNARVLKSSGTESQ